MCRHSDRVAGRGRRKTGANVSRRLVGKLLDLGHRHAFIRPAEQLAEIAGRKRLHEGGEREQEQRQPDYTSGESVVSSHLAAQCTSG